MKKSKKNNKKKETKKILVEKLYNNAKNKRIEIENDINKILDDLTIDELTELEKMGDFSKEAIEWIRDRKRRKKARKAQEDFEKRVRVSDEIIKRTVLIGKIMGFKNGQYKPKNNKEAEQLNKILQEQDIVREERERVQEKGDSRGRSGGIQKNRSER